MEGLRLIPGGAAPVEAVAADPVVFQRECVDAFVASWHARGFSPVTIDNDIGLLERTLTALGCPAWEVTSEDIDRVVGELAMAGRAASTRREYVQIFKGFHRFLQTRKAAEIEAAFGARLVCPVDEFNASRHVGDDSPAVAAPPTPERVSAFFEFLKTRIATARKYGPAARDYAMFRTLYHAGLRSEESALLEIPDVHFDRGPFGKLHVRFGKAAHMSGPRPRWVPMLDGLDVLLQWFLADVRPKFPNSPVLFADESGGALHRGTIRNRLRYLMELEGDRRPSDSAARAAPGLRHPQLRAWCGSGCDSTAFGALDGELDHAVRAAVGDVHRGRYRRAVTSTLAELSGEDGTA